VRIVRVDVPNHDAVYALARQTGLDVADAQPDQVIAYADDAMITRVRQLGYRVTVLVEDHTAQTPEELQTYHSYAQVCSTLHATALRYPAICRLETLGTSYGGRPIPGMKVTLGPGVEHDRPCIRLIGAHHGDERISTEVVLAFMLYLCENYASNAQVRALVDSREFWTVPILNADGHVSNSRYNGAGVDLNRDYGWEWEDEPTPFSQPETRAVMRHGWAHAPTIEYEYHSDASFVNYLWDNTPHDPADSAFLLAFSRRYADSTYGSSLTRLTPINGYDWYEVHGSCQDWVFGALGGVATTIETREPSTRPRVDSICLANQRALLATATVAGWGVRGRAYDSTSGEPLFARVEFTSPRRWHVYTNDSGGFCKMLPAGNFSLRVTSNGYNPVVFNGVAVPDTGSVVLDVPMTRPLTEPLNYAPQVVTLKRTDNSHLQTSTGMDALGEPDSRFYRVGPGNIEFRLDVPACDRTGDDVTVYATGTYTLAATNDLFGTWTAVGSGSGQQSFDLGTAGLDSCRYLRVTEQSTCQLDAVGYLGRERVGVNEGRTQVAGCGLQIVPAVVRDGRIFLSFAGTFDSPAHSSLSILDVSGRMVRRSPLAIRHSPLLLDVRGLPAGIYFCRLGPGPAAAARFAVVP
jgi:hypothetical protein